MCVWCVCMIARLRVFSLLLPLPPLLFPLPPLLLAPTPLTHLLLAPPLAPRSPTLAPRPPPPSALAVNRLIEVQIYVFKFHRKKLFIQVKSERY